MDLSSLRKQYRWGHLRKSDLNERPVAQFESWFKDAVEAGVLEPSSMALSTANKEGRPSSRTVLLKGFGEDGFVFYSNYRSRKGKELAQNPYACLLFYWKEVERQVIIEGVVEKLSEEESVNYFRKRPRESQLSAHASIQGDRLQSREELEERFHHLQKEHQGKEIKKPDYWGGYRLVPFRFEFWQGGENRMHDRFEYVREKNRWDISRLSP